MFTCWSITSLGTTSVPAAATLSRSVCLLLLYVILTSVFSKTLQPGFIWCALWWYFAQQTHHCCWHHIQDTRLVPPLPHSQAWISPWTTRTSTSAYARLAAPALVRVVHGCVYNHDDVQSGDCNHSNSVQAPDSSSYRQSWVCTCLRLAGPRHTANGMWQQGLWWNANVI